MATKRRNLLILVSAIGLPTLAAIGLFGYGLSIGDEHRADVLGFEERFLGIGPPGAIEPPEVLPPSASPRVTVAPPSPAPSLPSTASQEGLAAQASVDAGMAAAAADAAVPRPPPVGAAAHGTTPAGALAPGAPSSPGADVPPVMVTVRIKVLVDERFVRAEPRWLSIVEQTVAETSRAYQERVGIELVLQGIVRWPRALDGLSAPALLADLQSRPREGADVLLGVVGVQLEQAARSLAAPAPAGPRNGAYAVAGTDAQSELPHLRGMLWAVGRLLGARPVDADAGDEVSLGSWMSDGPAPADGRPWLDLENIQRIHARRGSPFELAPDAGGGIKAHRRPK